MRSSIVICTRNRAADLGRALRAVQRQEFPTDALEVLVVDNNSTDETPETARAFRHAPAFPVRYVFEPRDGLSHARNCGVAHARGEVVLFLDDDGLPADRHWAANLTAAYRDPDVCSAGGDLHPIWPDERRPDWIPDALLPPLGVTRFALTATTPLRYPHYPWGCNISYRRHAVQAAGGFLPALGWSSDNSTTPGEESELCLRLQRAGHKVVYVPDAAVNHVIAPHKLTEQWFMRRATGQGVSEAMIDGRHGSTGRYGLALLRRGAIAFCSPAGLAAGHLTRNRTTQLLWRYRLRNAVGYLRHAATGDRHEPVTPGRESGVASHHRDT